MNLLRRGDRANALSCARSEHVPQFGSLEAVSRTVLRRNFFATPRVRVVAKMRDSIRRDVCHRQVARLPPWLLPSVNAKFWRQSFLRMQRTPEGGLLEQPAAA